MTTGNGGNPQRSRAGWQEAAPGGKQGRGSPHYVGAPPKRSASELPFWRVLRIAVSGLVMLALLVAFVWHLLHPTQYVWIYGIKVNHDYTENQLPANAFVEEDFAYLQQEFPASYRVKFGLLDHSLAADLWERVSTARRKQQEADQRKPLHALSRFLYTEMPLVMVYVSAHGVVNEAGEPCFLSARNPLDQGQWLSLPAILEELHSLKEQPNSPLHKKKVLLILDSNKLDVDWSVGILDNGFVPALEQLAANRKELFEDVAILNSAALGQRGWSSPRLGGSLFGYAFTSGVRGAALQGSWWRRFIDPRMSLGELQTYLDRTMERLAEEEFGTSQHSLLVGDPAAADWTVAFTDRRMASPPVPQDLRPKLESFKELLSEINGTFRDRRPASHAPAQWSALQRSLANYVDRLYAGEKTTQVDQIDRVVRTLKQELATFLDWPQVASGSVYQLDAKYRDATAALQQRRATWEGWKQLAFTPPPSPPPTDPPQPGNAAATPAPTAPPAAPAAAPAEVPPLTMSLLDICRVEWQDLVQVAQRGGPLGSDGGPASHSPGNSTAADPAAAADRVWEAAQALLQRVDHPTVTKSLPQPRREPWELSFLRLMVDHPLAKQHRQSTSLADAVRAFDAASRAHHVVDLRVRNQHRSALIELDQQLRVALDAMYFESSEALRKIEERYRELHDKTLWPQSVDQWDRDDLLSRIAPALQFAAASPMAQTGAGWGTTSALPALGGTPSLQILRQIHWPDQREFLKWSEQDVRRLTRYVLPRLAVELEPATADRFIQATVGAGALVVATTGPAPHRSKEDTDRQTQRDQYQAYRQHLAQTPPVQRLVSYLGLPWPDLPVSEGADQALSVIRIARMEQALRQLLQQTDLRDPELIAGTSADDSARILLTLDAQREPQHSRVITAEQRLRSNWLVDLSERVRQDLWHVPIGQGSFYERAFDLLVASNDDQRELKHAQIKELKQVCESQWQPMRMMAGDAQGRAPDLLFAPYATTVADHPLTTGAATVYDVLAPFAAPNGREWTRYQVAEGLTAKVWFRGWRPSVAPDTPRSLDEIVSTDEKYASVQVSRFPPEPPNVLVILDCSQSMIQNEYAPEGAAAGVDRTASDGQLQAKTWMEVALETLQASVLSMTPQQAKIGVYLMGYREGVEKSSRVWGTTLFPLADPAQQPDAREGTIPYAELHEAKIADLAQKLGKFTDRFEGARRDNPTCLALVNAKLKCNRDIELLNAEISRLGSQGALSRDQIKTRAAALREQSSQLADAIAKQVPYGNTPLYASIRMGIETLRKYRRGAKQILVISDGMDSDLTREKSAHYKFVQDLLGKKQEELVFHFVAMEIEKRESDAHLKDFEQWASASNGTFLKVGQKRPLDQVLRDIVESMKFVLQRADGVELASPQDLLTHEEEQTASFPLEHARESLQVKLKRWDSPKPFYSADLASGESRLYSEAELVLTGGEQLILRYNADAADELQRTLDHKRYVDPESSPEQLRGKQIVPATDARQANTPYEVVFDAPDRIINKKREISIAIQIKRDIPYFYTPHPYEVWVEVTNQKQEVRPFPVLSFKPNRHVPQFTIPVDRTWLGDQNVRLQVWFTDAPVQDAAQELLLTDQSGWGGKLALPVGSTEFQVTAQATPQEGKLAVTVEGGPGIEASAIKIDLPGRDAWKCSRLVYVGRTQYRFQGLDPRGFEGMVVRAIPAQAIKQGFSASALFPQLTKD